MSKSAAKKESIATRLAAGEPPWDMLSLKAAIHAALPGSYYHTIYVFSASVLVLCRTRQLDFCCNCVTLSSDR